MSCLKSSNNASDLTTTYSFQLDQEAYPGTLGEYGDRVFRESFLERQFAVKMHNSLANGKKRAEGLPPSN